MQYRIVVSYRRFGTTYLFHLQGSSIPRRSAKSRILHECVHFAECCIFRNEDTRQMFTMGLWSGKCLGVKSLL